MKISFLTLLLSILVCSASFAQLPEKAEDISPLLVDERFPDLELIGMEGSATPFLSIIAEKPAVVIFYRGGWCPYCNVHLSEVWKIEEEILNLGFQVVAISPDNPTWLQETAGKDKLNYKLLSDASGDLAKAVGIAFKAPDNYAKRLSDRSDGKNTGFLPVPSVFVLDTNGKILFEYINPNYKKRLSGDLLLAVLKVLKTEMK